MKKLILLVVLCLVFTLPVLAQDATATVEVTAPVTVEATTAPTLEATAEATVPATAEATSAVVTEATAEATPAAVQEATAEATAALGSGETAAANTSSPVTGLTLLVMLMGIGAVVAVAGLPWLRDNFKGDDDIPA